MPNGVVEIYTYDKNNRVVGIVHQTKAGSIVNGEIYTLVSNGLRSVVQEYDNQSTATNGQLSNPIRTTAYRYDGINRLTQEAMTDRSGNTITTSYQYDLVGNRIQKSVTTNAGTEVFAYTYDSNNRLTTETDTAGSTQSQTTYAWDANGNLQSKTSPTQITIYKWDSQNRLMEVDQGASQSTVVAVANYVYDVTGNRIKKVEPNKVTNYLTDSNMAFAQVLEEDTTQNGSTTTTNYTWGDNLISLNRAGKQNYFHGDAEATTKALTDASGNVTDTYSFDAFGNLENQTGATDNSYRYTGEYFDNVAALQYNRARWYDPNVGRFVSEDIKDVVESRPASLNRYLYADANPVNFVDPSGEAPTLGEVVSTLNTVSNLYTVGTIAFQFATGNVAGGSLMIMEEVVYAKMGGAFGERIVKLSMSQLKLFYNIFGKNVKLILGAAANSTILRKNLEAVGVLKPSGTQAHHIVGGVTAIGKAMQAKLKALGIDLNSAMNGVFLPGCGKSKAIGMVHCGKHTAEYEEAVADRLRGAGTTEDAINILSDIRDELLAGAFTLLNKRAGI